MTSAIKLNTVTNGGISLYATTTATDKTLLLPAADGTLLVDSGVKTINGESIVGTGDLVIEAGGGSMGDFLTPQMFGAVPNSTDPDDILLNNIAFQAAFDELAVSTTTATLFIPIGEYYLNALITYTATDSHRGITILGEDQSRSKISYKGTSGCFRFLLGGYGIGDFSESTLTIKNLKFAARNVSAGIAILAEQTPSSGSSAPSAVFEDLYIVNEHDGVQNSWSEGIKIKQLDDVRFHRCYIPLMWGTSINSVHIENSLTNACFGIEFSDCSFSLSEVGESCIKATGNLESLTLNSCTLVAGADTLFVDGTGTPTGITNLLINSSHLNARRNTIRTKNVRTIMLIGVDVYSGTGFGDEAGTNLDVTDGYNVLLSGCKFEHGAAADIPGITRTGLSFYNVYNFQISGCGFYNGLNAPAIKIYGNSYTGTITGNTINSRTKTNEGIYYVPTIPSAQGDVVISDNVIENFAWGLFIAATKVIASNNIIKNCTVGVDAAAGVTAFAVNNVFTTVDTLYSGLWKTNASSMTIVGAASAPGVNWAGGGNLLELTATGAYSEPAIAATESGSNTGAKIGFKNTSNGAYDIIFATRNNTGAATTLAERVRIKNDGSLTVKNCEGSYSRFAGVAPGGDVFPTDIKFGVTASAANIGGELITNGTFTGSATGWTLGTGWAYSVDSVVCTLGGSAEGTVRQNITVELNKYYRLLWVQTNSVINNGHITPSLGTAVGVPVATGTSPATNEFVFIALATGSVELSFAVTDITSTGTITIDTVSLKELVPTAANLTLQNSTVGEKQAEFRSYWNGVNNLSVGIGWKCLQSVISGTNNTVIGSAAGAAITTGSNNALYGAAAGTKLTTGNGNAAVGVASLRDLTSGSNNVGIGRSAGQALTTGYTNVAIGVQALTGCTTGYENLAIGGQSLQLTTTGNSNTAIGQAALQYNTTGFDNVGIGYGAGQQNTTGANNIMIGKYANAVAATTSNSITLGNSSVTSLRCQVTTITALSDSRDKTDIEPLPYGINFINSLNPVKFTWNMRDGGIVGTPDMGFIAQDLKAAQEAVDAKEVMRLVLEDNPERLEATSGRLLPIMVKALQELSAKVAALEAKLP